MEPAAGRRDDKTVIFRPVMSPPGPQWSPPRGGGMTSRFTTAVARKQSPQWSPPLDGGMTARKIRAA